MAVDHYAVDHYGRRIDYLRISVIDRCNLRCLYCMPAGKVSFKSAQALLSDDEIVALVRIAAGEGITRIRLTGGEPLMRRGIVGLVGRIAEVAGVEQVAMTTNGILLPRMAHDLRAAGLSRVNISLDTLDAAQYRSITRRGDIEDVHAGIRAALGVGFSPVKLNVVVVRSLHQDFLSFVRLAFERPVHVRFIEYMPLGRTCEGDGTGWTAADTIPNEELIGLIERELTRAGLGHLRAVEAMGAESAAGVCADGESAGSADAESAAGGVGDAAVGADAAASDASGAFVGWGPARYYAIDGAQGMIGFISALSNHFCRSCNRLRVTAEGKLRSCLFSDVEYDLRSALRVGDDGEVRRVLRAAVAAKPEEHHNQIGTTRPMSQIGG